jgi:hypothetical protein
VETDPEVSDSDMGDLPKGSCDRCKVEKDKAAAAIKKIDAAIKRESRMRILMDMVQEEKAARTEADVLDIQKRVLQAEAEAQRIPKKQKTAERQVPLLIVVTVNC